MNENNDQDVITLAFDLLESAEVLQEFKQDLWLKVDRETWEALCQSWERV